MEITVKKTGNEQYVNFSSLLMFEFFECEHKLFMKIESHKALEMQYQNSYEFNGEECIVQVNKVNITYET